MTNDKIQMTNEKNKKFDLEDRTLRFAINVIYICNTINKDVINENLIHQLIRASGSIGANYREANDSISKKSFYHLIGICRREAKETRYWLQLLQYNNSGHKDRLDFLIDEAFQLAKIFASIGKKIFDNFKIIYSIVIDALTFVIKERSYT